MIFQSFGDATAFGDLGTVVAVSGAPLRLFATRRNGRIRISQVTGRGDGRRVRRTKLRSDRFDQGIKRFLRFDVSRRNGKHLVTRYEDFCPNSPAYRIDELDRSIAQQPTFPSSCGHILSRAMVWGIDRGWAANATPSTGFTLPAGRYRLKLTIDPGHRLLDRRRSNNSLTLPMKIEEAPPDPPFEEPPPEARASGFPKGTQLPDLQALPAFSVGLTNDGSSEQITFSSTVWNAGPGPIWLEGRRGKRADRMDTLQVLPRRGGRAVRRPVNAFVFDLRDGHGHWHYNGLARYRLLNRDGKALATAAKQGFCFLPTDPIDLTVPGAVLVPPTDFFGAGACGRAFSVAVRMRLDAGWGDTYGAGLAGQALDITGIPDGTYFIEVSGNATGRLIERTKANDVSRRRIILKTVEGTRSLKVPPISGIDTEDIQF